MTGEFLKTICSHNDNTTRKGVMVNLLHIIKLMKLIINILIWFCWFISVPNANQSLRWLSMSFLQKERIPLGWFTLRFSCPNVFPTRTELFFITDDTILNKSKVMLMSDKFAILVGLCLWLRLSHRLFSNGSRYSRIDQVKFVEGSL